MKVLFINSVYGLRSTGKIVAELCHTFEEEGASCYVACGRGTIQDDRVTVIPIGNRIDHGIHALLTRSLDLQGFCSYFATRRLLKEMDRIHPDLIWLHNIHGYYLQVELLFAWLKKHPEVEVRWTLHDCWAFTGHCAYFTMARCEQWKTGCRNCSQLKSYPKTFGSDHVDRNYLRKKKAFCGVKNLKLITPSAWLAGLTRESFLREYPVEVIHNKIDTQVFHPCSSDFRSRYGIEDRYMLLGVAVGWEETKGFPDVLSLRELLDERFVIVLVGVSDRQIQGLPPGIIGLKRTAIQQQLAELYSTADVFINPTHQDNYPTVNLEARACGTPVVTYDVGGSPESADPDNVLPEGDLVGMAQRIREICGADDE